MTIASPPTVSGLLATVERLRPLIEEHALEAEANRRLSPHVYQAMVDAGLFGMMAPQRFGGMELPPTEVMPVWEAVARIDSAAAWNLVMNQVIASYAAWLPAQGADELFGGGPTTVAGAFSPPAAASRVHGGWRVTGRVPFASGCDHAAWVALPALETNGDGPKLDSESGQPVPFACFFRREDVEIIDTWHTVGMRGTGSADLSVTDVWVPDHLTAPVGPLEKPAPGFEGPLFRMWPWPGPLGEATVSVGVAAAAVDQAIELAKTRVPSYSTTPMREQALSQQAVGKAKARVDASRDTLHRAAEEGYRDAVANPRLSWETKTRLQLAASFAAEACAEAVRLVNDAVGSAAIRTGEQFERHFRDAHVMTQHASKSAPRYASAGRLLFGLENDWFLLSF